jgi:hypothetical protein
MIGPTWTPRVRKIIIANSLATVAVLLAMVTHQPVAVAALGSEWQCSKTAFVLTTCRPAPDGDVTQRSAE